MAESKTKAEKVDVQAETANVKAETVNVGEPDNEPAPDAAASALSFQCVDVSVVTGINGRFVYDFDSPIDQVLATVNSPDVPLLAVATVTGEKQATVRVFKADRPLSSKRVNVTLLGVTH